MNKVCLKAQPVIGAKAMSMGQATVVVPGNEWALFANPAMMNTKKINIGFYGLRNYGLVELTDMAAAGIIPTKYGAVSAGFHRYGDNLFSETRIRFGYKNEWKNLHFGIAGNYNHIAFGNDYGSGGALGIDAGIAAVLSDKLWIGAKASNLNYPAYRGIEEDLPRDLSLGFSYFMNEKILFAFDMVKDVRFPVSYRGGLDILIIENLNGRVGITTEPLTYSLGFGYGKEKWAFNFALQKHSLLGFSPGLDLLFYF